MTVRFLHHLEIIINQIRKAKANFFIEIIKGTNGNGKLIWENLNDLLGRNKDINFKDLQLQVKGMLTDNLDIIVNSFNRYFISSVEDLTMHFKCPNIPYKPLDANKPIFSIQDISVPDVIKIISSLKSSKARDTFGFTNDLLKLHKEALASPIAHLINLSIKQGIVP